MKKAISLIITILVVVAGIWTIFNFHDYELITQNMITKPYVKVATWDSQHGYYISDDNKAYKLCQCAFNSCSAGMERGDIYHPYNYDPEKLIYTLDNSIFYHLEPINNCLWRDAVDLENRLNHMSLKFDEHTSDGAPELPSIPSFSEYVGGSKDVLDAVSNFFTWFGNLLVFLFEVIVWAVKYLVYLFGFGKIFIQELLL